MYQCPYCKFSNTDLNRLRMHVMTQHSVQPMFCCPLCQDMLNNKVHLQFHLTHLHSVAPDCVDKLIASVSYRRRVFRGDHIRLHLPFHMHAFVSFNKCPCLFYFHSQKNLTKYFPFSLSRLEDGCLSSPVHFSLQSVVFHVKPH